MLGTGGDADSNAGPLFTPACLGYRHYNGGGQPLSLTVPQVQYASALAGAEKAAYHHRSVRQGGGEKETTDGGRGYVVECGEGLSAYGRTLKTVTSFKYMWMVFTVVYDN